MKTVLLAIILAASAFCARAESNAMHIIDGVKYSVENKGNAVVWGIDESFSHPAGEINIPGSIRVDGADYPVTAVGPNAFSFCETLVNLPESIEEICGCSFMGAKLPEEVNLPSIRRIYGQSMSGTGTKKLVLGPELYSLGGYALCEDITELVFESHGKTDNWQYGLWASMYAFSNLKKLKELKLPPHNYLSLSGRAVEQCAELERVVFPDIESIRYAYCSADLSIPLATRAYACWIMECPKLKEVVCLGSVPPEITGLEIWGQHPDREIASDKFRVTDNVEECVLKVPAGSEELYRAHSVWGDFKTIYGFENGDYTSIAVPEMTDAAFCAPEYYNLQGIRVVSPVKGQMYIRVSGTQSDKIVY